MNDNHPSGESIPEEGTNIPKLGMVYIGDLSPDLQEAIRFMIEKARKGSIEHGPLDVMSDDWLAHLLEEEADAGFYRVFQLMKLRRLGGSDACGAVAKANRGG